MAIIGSDTVYESGIILARASGYDACGLGYKITTPAYTTVIDSIKINVLSWLGTLSYTHANEHMFGTVWNSDGSQNSITSEKTVSTSTGWKTLSFDNMVLLDGSTTYFIGFVCESESTNYNAVDICGNIIQWQEYIKSSSSLLQSNDYDISGVSYDEDFADASIYADIIGPPYKIEGTTPAKFMDTNWGDLSNIT